MRIATAAYPITQHTSIENWQMHTETWVKKAVNNSPDILLFPEYGSMELVSLLPQEKRTTLAEELENVQNFRSLFQTTYQQLAQQYHCIIVAPSFPYKLNDIYVNRCMVFAPSGNHSFQDKLIMTPFERLEWGISAGEKVLRIFETDKGNFGIQICYDAEFGIGSLLMAQAGAQVILMPSCTETESGAARVHIAARARALENQCYTVVSQTIGQAAWSATVDLNYGYCAAYATPDFGFPAEGILQTSPPQEPQWLYQDFDSSPLAHVRQNGAVRNFEDHQLLSFIFEKSPFIIERVKL